MYQIEEQLNKLKGDHIKLTEKQNYAYKRMSEGKNIFLTGNAGTGKSSVIKLFARMHQHQKIGVTSTTGISAILLNGSTLHSYLGIGLGTGTVDAIVNTIIKKKNMYKRWTELQILIIDEISMLSPDLFEKLESVARILRRNAWFFGGIQLILSGDFLQLPCVDTDKFCFESPLWNKLDEQILLTEIIRQEDKEFQECLNGIRLGRVDTKIKKMLSERLNVKLTNDFGIKPTKLYSLNVDVNNINEQELKKLVQDFYEYDMEIEMYPSKFVTQYIKEKMRKGCLAIDHLQLAIGAQVMLIHNLDINSQLVNGSRGVVIGFVDDLPIVKFVNGIERIIDFHIWECVENDHKLGRIIQIPLKLAYAISIHKSQGCSLDYVEIDLSNIFEYGQAYVALSRAKNLSGLSIIGIDWDKIKSHPRALEFYNLLCKQ
jgi:ATP-dependent DNA helicase PIF1